MLIGSTRHTKWMTSLTCLLNMDFELKMYLGANISWCKYILAQINVGADICWCKNMLVQIYVGSKKSWCKYMLVQKVNNEGQLRWLGPEKGVIGDKKSSSTSSHKILSFVSVQDIELRIHYDRLVINRPV